MSVPTPLHATDSAVPASLGGRLWSRRSFLGTLAVLAAGAASGCTFGGGDQQDFAGGAAGHPTGSGPVSAGDPGYTLTPPLSLQASCELSEDYFLVTNHRIDPEHDTVVAYSRADGDVEAVILQDQVVKQVYRDVTQAGGWNVNALPDANDVLFMVAGVSGPVTLGQNQATEPVLKVFYVKRSDPRTLFIATEDGQRSDGAVPTFTTTSIPWADRYATLQITTNFDNSLLVTAMVVSSSPDVLDGKLYYYADGLTADHRDGQPLVPAYGYLSGFAFAGWNSPLEHLGGPGIGWSAIVTQVDIGDAVPQLWLMLPAGSYGKPPNSPMDYPSVLTWSWTLRSGQQQAGPQPIAGEFMLQAAQPPTSQTYAYSIEALSVQGGHKLPAAVVRTMDTDDKTQHLWLLSPNNKSKRWSWTELGLPFGVDPNAPVLVSTATRPILSSLNEVSVGGSNISSFLDVFVHVGNQLSVIRQAPQGDAVSDSNTPRYCPLIPLQPDVAFMTSQAGSSTGNELLLVGADGTLETLLKDPVTGHWADGPIQLPSSELQQVSAYRVELTLQDSWNSGVPHQPLKVTAATPVTAMVDGQTVNLGALPVTVATDDHGQTVIALVADGLSAPTLTFTADGVSPAIINPSAPLNTYMQGGTPLNYQPPLSADTLQSAKTSDGEVVAPNLSDADAKDGVGHMSTAAGWAANPSLSAGRKSATLDRRDGRLGGRNAEGQMVTTQGILSDINSWTHDALHAIKKAAVAVTAIAVDAANKTFTLTADFALWAEKGLTIVIHGIEDAAHVFHAVLNKIKASILKALKWLEAEVLGVLRDSAALAHQYDTWLGQCTDFIGKQLSNDSAAVDAWLAGQQASLGDKFTALAGRFAPGTTLSTMAANPPKGLSGQRPSSDAKTVDDDDDDDDAGQGSPHGHWFLNKVKNALLGQLDVPDMDGLEKMVSEVFTAIKNSMTEFRAAFEEFWTFLKGAIEHPSKVATLGVQALLMALSDLVEGMFILLRGVVDAMMTFFASLASVIPDMLATELKALPIVGKLLELVGLGNIKIVTLFTLVLAFPTVLAYKIAHKGKGRPFAGGSVGGTDGRLGAGDEATDLQFCAGGALLAWAGLDTLSGAYTASGATAPMFFSAVDIAAPLIVTVLTVPATNGGEPFFSPPDSGNGSDEMNFASWILGAIPAFSVAAGVVVDQKLKARSDVGEFKALLLQITSVCGLCSLITGCVGNDESADASGADYAVAVLNNMANIVALLLEDGFVKSSDGFTAVVAAAITISCGSIGAILYGVDG